MIKAYPKFSVVTVCLNSEQYIETAIKSVIGQTYPSIEYIIIDGGSTDTTIDIIHKYRNNIDIFISEPDGGVFEAFNKGLELATGDFVYFLNSDDYLYNNEVIEHVAQMVKNDAEVQFVYGNVELLNEKNGFFDVVGKEVSLKDIKKGKMPYHSSTFSKRDLLVKYGGFDLSYRFGSDTDLIVKIFKNHTAGCRYINEVISTFRLGGISSQLKNRNAAIQEINHILKKNFSTTLDTQESLLNTNLLYYRKWIETLLYDDHPISKRLEGKVRNVAIFGTREVAMLVKQDLMKSSINTIAFLDNNQLRQGKLIQGVPVMAPSWLTSHANETDAVILAFEGDYEVEVREQIAKLTGHEKVVISWKELIADYRG